MVGETSRRKRNSLLNAGIPSFMAGLQSLYLLRDSLVGWIVSSRLLWQEEVVLGRAGWNPV